MGAQYTRWLIGTVRGRYPLTVIPLRLIIPT